MVRQYPPYGIQGERRHVPTVRDVLAAIWSCPGVQLFVLFAVAVLAFALGFVTGANCEATRQMMTYQ